MIEVFKNKSQGPGTRYKLRKYLNEQLKEKEQKCLGT